MKGKLRLALCGFVITALLLGAGPALAAGPILPHAFYGTVAIGEHDAPVGSVVSAEVGGVDCGSYSIRVAGRYGNLDERDYLTVQGDIANGDTITFYVNGVSTSQTAAFEAGGGPTRLDLTVPETVPSVATSAATSVTTSSATLNGNLGSLGTALSVEVSFEWGTTTAYGNTATVTASPLSVPDVFSASVSGLSSGTTYHFRAKAMGDGTSYGIDSTFTTGTVPTVPPAVTTNPATGVTTTLATLNGSLTDLGTATAVGVSFEWGETSAYGNETTPQTMTSTGAFSFSLSGLSPNTTYHFRAKAVGDGTSYGIDSTFTTGTVPTVPPAVTTDPATGVTTTLATLNVSLTDLGTATSVSVSFEWGETSAYGNETTPQTMTSTGAFSSSLSGLSPDTTYHFRAKAVGDGTSYTIDSTFTTGTVPTVPPAVTTNPATGVTTTTLATLNGSLTDLGTATAVGVSFEWGETSAYGNETTPQTMTSTGAFSSSLNGLSSNTTYHFRAKAVGDGTSYGLDRSFTTGVKKVVTIPPGQTDYVVDASDIADTTITVDTTAEVTIAVTKYYSNPHPGATPPADTDMLPRYIDIDVDNPLAIDWPMSVEQSYSDDEVAGLDESSLGMCYFTADPLPDGAWHRCSDTGVYEDINTVWANIWKGELPGSPIAIGGIAAPEPEPVAPSLVTNAATSVTTSSATLNGNLGSLGTALSVEVSFEWGTTTTYGNETTPQTMTSTGAFSFSLSGLSSGTTYHFRAKAGGDGTSYGIDRAFTTRARGGGGGGAPSPAAPPAPPPGTTDVRGQVSDAGVFLESVTATSEDELCTLTIPEGTVGLTEELEPLTEITTLIMNEPPPPPEAANVIGLAYDLGPDGATFDPPITLTFSYDPSDIPEGIAEEDLAIAYYDQAAGEWVELEDCVVDIENNTITASVSHFTTFTIIGAVTPPEEEEVAPPEEEEVAPPEEEEVAPPEEEEVAPPEEEELVPEVPAPINWLLLGAIIAVVVVIGLLAFFLVRRRAQVTRQ